MAEKKTSTRAAGNKQDIIKLDAETRRWVDALKSHYGAPSDIEAVKRAILVAHPNIREVAG